MGGTNDSPPFRSPVQHLSLSRTDDRLPTEVTHIANRVVFLDVGPSLPFLALPYESSFSFPLFFHSCVATRRVVYQAQPQVFAKISQDLWSLMNSLVSRLIPRNKYCKPLFQISTFRPGPMNLRFASVVSVLATSSAWIPPSNTLSIKTCQPPSLSFPRSRASYSDFSRKSTAIPEEVASPALSPQGKPVADGHVVSAFKGGFIAIRVDDDIAQLLTSSPEIVDTTKKILKESKSSSLGKWCGITQSVEYPLIHPRILNLI